MSVMTNKVIVKFNCLIHDLKLRNRKKRSYSEII